MALGISQTAGISISERINNLPVVRSLSASLVTTLTPNGNETIKWTFDDTVVQAKNPLNNYSTYLTDTPGTVTTLSSMVFYVSPDTYNYKTEKYTERRTTIRVTELTANEITGETIDDGFFGVYNWEYDTFPGVVPPVIYINYENTDYSSLFYRAQAAGTTYNARISAVFDPSFLNLTNLLTGSEIFTSNIWSTVSSLSVLPIRKTTPVGTVSSTLLKPISGVPFGQIFSITNIISADLPTTFLHATSTYTLPMSAYTTTGSGVSAIFTLSVATSTISAIQIADGGRFFRPNDTITINQSALGLDPDSSNTISFEVDRVLNLSHQIGRTVGPLAPQTYTYSVYASPSGGRYLYFDGFNQGPVIFDLRDIFVYNLGKWIAADIDIADPDSLPQQNPEFNVDFNGEVKTVAVSGDRIFFGGDFTTCNGQTVNRICAVNFSGNLLTSGFAPSGFNSTVNTIALSGDRMYVGGSFTTYRGNSATYITCLTGNGGIASTAVFNGNTNAAVENIRVQTNQDYISVCGPFSSWSNHNGSNSGLERYGLVTIYPNGLEVPLSAFEMRGISSGNLTWNNESGAGSGGKKVTDVRFLPDGSAIIVGDFNAWRGEPDSSRIAKTKTNPGEKYIDRTFGDNRPVFNNTINRVAIYNTDIIVGGNFTTPRSGLTRLLNTGFEAPAATYSFSPGADIKDISILSNGMYVAGNFTQYNSLPYAYLIRINPDTNLVDGTFNTQNKINNVVNSTSARLTAVDSTVPDRIYTGGIFTRYDSRQQNRVTCLSPTNATIVTLSSELAGATDWLRCCATFTLTSTETDKLYLGITTDTENISSAAVSTDDIYVFGSQLNYLQTGTSVPYLSTGTTTRTRYYNDCYLYFNNQATPAATITLLSSTIYSSNNVFSIGSVPRISSVQVVVSATGTYDSFESWWEPHTFSNSISAIFVSKFLSADFIGWPSYYFLSSGDLQGPFAYTGPGYTGYTSTPGLCFYGEGHTETINLCANGTGASQYFWNIETDTVVYEISASSNAGFYQVFIPTVVGDYPSIPISLIVSDGTILSSGPVYYFNDTDGSLSAYPFYYNTEALSSKNTKYKKNIDVVSYIPPASSFNSGFLECPVFLPTDDSSNEYTAFLTFLTSGGSSSLLDSCYGLYNVVWRWNTFKNLSAAITTPPFGTTPSYTDITTTLVGKPSSWSTTISLSAPSADPAFGTIPSSPGPYPKTWLLQSSTEAIEKTPNTSWGSPLVWTLSTPNWTTQTLISAGNPNFIYSLQYYFAGLNPNTFSIYKNIPLYLQGQQTVYTVISAPPYDWDVKEYTYQGNEYCEFLSRGDFRIYTSNRYVLTGTQVKFQNISLGFNGVDRIEVDLDEDNLITLNNSSLYNDLTATYSVPGYKTITSTVYYIPSATEQAAPVTSTFTDIIKVVSEYDTIDTDNYRSQKTPLTLPYSEPPYIAPNEWVNDDTINSVVEKFYDNLEYLQTRSRSYNDGPDEFYGWLGVPTADTDCPTYTWDDVDCLNGGTDVKWEDLQTIDPDIPSLSTNGALVSCCTWDQHTCNTDIQNPDHLGKYCIDWKWISRKSNVSTIPVTWANTQSNRSYNKKWRFEPCTTRDGVVLLGSACNEGEWQVDIEKINTYYDPITNCSVVPRCIYKDIVSKDNILYVALTNEVKVLSSDYSATFVTSKLFIDEIFAFDDIRGLALDSTGKLFVIDGTLNKIASYIVDLTSPTPFELFLSWGGFGTVSSTSKFSQPNDICIDTLDNVWVADSGNKCVKQFTNTGTWLQTIADDSLRNTPPISMTADSQNNIHVLTNSAVRVYSSTGEFIFEYTFTDIVTNKQPIKINSNYNKEIIYIVFENKVLRYFRTGVFAGYLINEKQCSGNINDAYQDEFRNTLVISNDKILKYVDVMDLKSIAAPMPDTYWPLSDLLIHKEEYVQNWVYNKTFQRLWDNIEIVRSSLFFEGNSCKSYKQPIYGKDKILIGQNEIVTSTVINRNIQYLWENLKTMFDYFDPNCTEES